MKAADRGAAAGEMIHGVPKPPSAVLLGWTLKEFDEAEKRLKLGFHADGRFLNPAGLVQGGILAAMMDDTMGPLFVLLSAGRFFPSTTDLHTWYLNPAYPGDFTCEARVQRQGGTIGFVEADLWDAKGVLVAKGQSTVRLLDLARSKDKAAARSAGAEA